jgi:adenosylhomocysteinase
LRDGPPELRDVSSFTNQVLAQLELRQRHDRYQKKVYCAAQGARRGGGPAPPRQLGVRLTQLTGGQAIYIGVAGRRALQGRSYRY